MIRIVGMGPGTPEWVAPAIRDSVKQCGVLLGGSRALKLFPDFKGDTYQISGNLSETLEKLQRAIEQGKQAGVLVSGDPGYYSLLPLLKREFPHEEIQVFPGISSIQFAFARAGIPWQEAELLSVHGRSLNSLPLNLKQTIGILTGGENTPQAVARYYQRYGFNPRISVGNALSYPEERWLNTDAQELMDSAGDFTNAVMLLYPEETKLAGDASLLACPKGFGINDEEFIRGNVPMTKSEIRIQVLAKAEITASTRILDVGAGTGSIGIEAALLAQRGCVYAVEENPEAQELILLNQEKFQIRNLRLIRGAAPVALQGIPPMDVCIIGGSHGQIQQILQQAPLVPGGRVVMTAVTIETLASGMEALKSLAYQDIDVVSIQAVRWKGMGIKDIHLAQAQNPVFIISGRKKTN
ncbi:precorrin-6y C5,15-methyltransferase (decarboxylating), CbiE subunit,precorrin-6Y C5,15-methyltransferase (decarboxylating), CbiT subunit [Desulfitobacterium dichloroeliminans LMG P-21439]|uniref:Precorrin-6y C5,15-methyltransferase (Decarboxylating), CbiE subunit,precorrin-6Y C5,15-methyltransferase (Decarboxylating), CbiT subunit n=1 Tax=Desulfitobacterium dichloroeliminans (strain LMG P-21439 / DCA1) TaxID=871963 RepID=L0F7C5_DESDL|nr:bifunctional cobalt-precorrin-7 (C(5))-methyltransferase/cobalt-precorrin-6B (C(15))-methyltransferase [Desulfitobacterium dichloroeliminans]AGA68536.1 precorrin-6y C5,15-methyltransferase (decarboxylating), CbiE subunit,precorrin-6Y C5,15-methyltransferase (decarboxylating), CbiT subunit [Desulfitobacterium dichloroeliminans LMG P-21439]